MKASIGSDDFMAVIALVWHNLLTQILKTCSSVLIRPVLKILTTGVGVGTCIRKVYLCIDTTSVFPC